jgi:hypothetical protein
MAVMLLGITSKKEKMEYKKTERTLAHQQVFATRKNMKTDRAVERGGLKQR